MTSIWICAGLIAAVTVVRVIRNGLESRADRRRWQQVWDSYADSLIRYCRVSDRQEMVAYRPKARP